ncbi:hypothetical protein HY68_33770, partial [Streptomyces sp. AcH 505]|uniref:hypothetical protein n=1 Tax=Streptomyces sp. AcH 505 TaxID=352211 RepID=UPI0005922967
GGPAGWHALRWTVPSTDDASDTLKEHGVRVAERAPGGGLFTEPDDLHGLRLEIVRATAAETGERGTEDTVGNPLGLTGPPTVKLTATDPAAAAAALSALVGQPAYATENSALNTTGHGVALADHRVEFIGSRSGSVLDRAGAFLAAHGERICWLTLQVADFGAARSYLVGREIPFTQWGARSLFLEADTMSGAPVELSFG